MVKVNRSARPSQDFKMQSVTDMGVQYINGIKTVKSKRKQGKKILAGFLPPMELGFCSEQTLPFFLPRFTEFSFQAVLDVLTHANRFRLVKLILDFWDQFESLFAKIPRSGGKMDTQGFSNAFSGLNQIAANANFYLDSCVQTRVCYGAYLKYQQFFDLLLGGFEGNYCLHFAKFYERIGMKKPVFYIEKPFGDHSSQHRMELVRKELEDFFKAIEDMTGEDIDFNYVKKRMKKVNDTKNIAALILKRYYQKGYVPLHWIASLLVHGAYVDFLSDIDFFHEKLRLLIAEIERGIKTDTIRNYKKEGIPRILIAGSPGFDPQLPPVIEKQGGCFLYCDIFQSLQRHHLIDLTGDFIDKYAHYLLVNNVVRGTEDLIDMWIEKAKLLDADGIVFNEVWGCRFITPSFKLFKDRVREELEIPVVGVNFHNFGENIGQVSTRIEAFMELIQ